LIHEKVLKISSDSISERAYQKDRATGQKLCIFGPNSRFTRDGYEHYRHELGMARKQ
jgi:hypothetical protein